MDVYKAELEMKESLSFELIKDARTKARQDYDTSRH